MVATSMIQKCWTYCRKTFFHTLLLVFKIAGTTFSSDMRKPLLDNYQKLVSRNLKSVLFLRKLIYINIIVNRMRSLHSCITICVLATVHIWSCKLEWYTCTFILQGLCEMFTFFSKFIWVSVFIIGSIHIWNCNCTWYSNSSKTCL